MTTTNTTHRLTWFVWVNGEKIRRQASMRGAWGYDVECSCGWQSRTGGATMHAMRNEIARHKLGARLEEEVLNVRVEDGARVSVDQIGDYDGAGYRAAGTLGTVLGYATPEIQKRQVWKDETYWIRLDGDSPTSRRAINRNRFVVLPEVYE